MAFTLPAVFPEFLASLGFEATDDKIPPIFVVRPESQRQTALGEHYTEPAIEVHQKTESKLTLAGAQKFITRRLQAIDHVANENVVNTILGCSVGFAESGVERAKFLSALLSAPRQVDVSHFQILPNMALPQLGSSIEFGGYALGRLNYEALAARCRRAQSDYAVLYENRVRGHVALQSPIFERVVLNPISPSIPHLLDNKFWRNLMLSYFGLVAHQHTEAMWLHLAEVQVLARPFSANIVEVSDLRNSFVGQLAQQVTIYVGITERPASGYVVPTGGGVTVVLNQIDADSECVSRFHEHIARYRLDEHGDSALARTAKACAGFCQEAMRRIEAGNNNEAALYATIALEHLFSAKQNTAATVASRTAALTQLRMGQAGFSETEDEVKKLYDARSRFVHSGASCTAEDAARLIDYARESTRSLLVLHLNPANRHSEFLDQWVKNLDLVVASCRAGKTFDNEFLANCGIFRD